MEMLLDFSFEQANQLWKEDAARTCHRDMLPKRIMAERAIKSGAEMPGDGWSQLHGDLEGRSEEDSKANRADLPEPMQHRE